MLLPESSFVPVGEEGSQSVSQKAKLHPRTWGSAHINRVSPHALAQQPQGHAAEGYFQKGFSLGKGRHRSAGVCLQLRCAHLGSGLWLLLCW